MAALVAVLVLCMAGLTAVSMHIRCVDAAREAARPAPKATTVAMWHGISRPMVPPWSFAATVSPSSPPSAWGRRCRRTYPSSACGGGGGTGRGLTTVGEPARRDDDRGVADDHRRCGISRRGGGGAAPRRGGCGSRSVGGGRPACLGCRRGVQGGAVVVAPMHIEMTGCEVSDLDRRCSRGFDPSGPLRHEYRTRGGRGGPGEPTG